MKKHKWMWIVGMSVLLFAGCQTAEESKQEEAKISTQTIETMEDGNPFDLEAIEKSGQIIEATYGWGVADYDGFVRKIDLGEKASTELRMEIDSTNECEVGYMIFVDGIPQQYQIGEEKGYLIPVDCPKGSSEITLQITPQVPNIQEEYTVHFMCLYHPSFRLSAESTHYGNYHNMSQLLPWKIKGAFSEENVAISTDVTYQPISEELKEQYIRVNRDGTIVKKYETTLYSKFYQNGVETDRFDGGENTQLVLFGGPEDTYRVSLFVEHQPVAAFSGAEYIDVTMKNEHMAIIDLDFPKEMIEDYSCVYAILCPQNVTGIGDEPIAEKTASITLFR